MLDLNTVVVRSKKVPWRIIDKEVVLVDVEKGEVSHSNPVGAMVWELIDGERNISEIISGVCENFEVDGRTAEKDVFDFVRTLSEKKLVIWSEKK
ncbi:PqqD family protein [Candidatus Margulisiibacteriota bacterium]